MLPRNLSVLLLLTALGCRAVEPLPAAVPLAARAGPDRARVELGRDLFFDPSLSADGTVACASCHAPGRAGADGRARSIGVGGARADRNAPTVYNTAFKRHLFWDGRATSLKAQALGPLFAAHEMAATEASLRRALEPYRPRFERAFPDSDDAVTVATLTRALAAYQRALITPSRVDAYLRGDAEALNAQEVAGLKRFQRNCAFCHDGPGVGGARLQRLGDVVPWPAERSQDLGRYRVTGDDADRLVFAVPSLRNVSDTAPYFHDGSVATLEEAVRLMGRHQLGEDLDDDAVDELVAFLRALRGAPDPALIVSEPSRR